MRLEWTIGIEAAGDQRVRPADELVVRLVERLASRGGVVDAAPGCYFVRFDVSAPDAESAVHEGSRILREAAAGVGLPAWPVVRVEVTTIARQAAELAAAGFPDVVGVSEAAALLGVSRQRLDQLTAREDFPEPMVRLAAGPIWLRWSLEAFLRRWPRKPGRPARRSPEPAHPVDEPAQPAVGESARPPKEVAVS
jgi:hypothetical protein